MTLVTGKETRMLLILLKLILSLALSESPDAIDERSHVACYAILDTPLVESPFAASLADDMCSDSDSDDGIKLAVVIPW